MHMRNLTSKRWRDITRLDNLKIFVARTGLKGGGDREVGARKVGFYQN